MNCIVDNQEINKAPINKELLPNRNVVHRHLFNGAVLFGEKTMEEIWRPIKGYEGHYEVSNLGREEAMDGVKREAKRLGIKYY